VLQVGKTQPTQGSTPTPESNHTTIASPRPTPPYRIALARRTTCDPRRPQPQRPHHRLRCPARAARRRRLAQRVAASPARRPKRRLRHRPPSHTAPPPHRRLRVATHRCDRQKSSIPAAAPSSRVAETAAACSRPKTLDREVQDASRDCSNEARHNHHHPCHSNATDSPSAVRRSPKQATPLHHMPCAHHPPLNAAPTCGRRAPKRSHPCPRSPRPTRSRYTQTFAPAPPPPHAPRRRSATAQLLARLVAGTNATAETDAHSATTRPPV